MHGCKVVSHTAAIVSKEEYEKAYERVKQSLFFDALQKSKEAVMKQPYVYEKESYQKEFAIPMKRNIFGLFTIVVYINHVRCQMVVDTGAQISGLKEAVIQKLNLPKTKGILEVGSIGGTQKKMQGYLADSLQFGGIAYRNLPIIAMDSQEFTLRFAGKDVFGFDGILGWDLLSQLDFEMDDMHKQFIVLRNRFKLPHPNSIVGGFPCLLAKRADGEISLFGFDSGSRVSWIGENAIEQHHLEVAYEAKAMGFGVHGLEEMELKIVKEWVLYVDKAKITLKDTMSGRTALFQGFQYDGVFGNEIFKGRRIRFINSAKMVLLA